MSDRSSRSDLNEAFLETGFLDGANALFVEEMHARFADDPASVPESWRRFFEAVGDRVSEAIRGAQGPSWGARGSDTESDEMTAAFDGRWPDQRREPRPLPTLREGGADLGDGTDVRRAVIDSIRALMMIRAYRIRGHLAADLDPLRMTDFGVQPELDPATYGFGSTDLDRPIFIDGVLGLETATIRQMVDILKRTYCGTFAVEFMHISNPREKAWLQERIEGPDKGVVFTQEGKKAIMKKLIEAETFERFLHKRFPGTKRFGVDGGESMVPALEQIIKRGGAMGVQDIVIGMPHRGRLNVLAAVMGKPYHAIFHEFQTGDTLGESEYGSGDVKYHLGASFDREFDGNPVHLSLTANPSHLEAVNPVVLGKARAKQQQIGRLKPGKSNIDRSTVMPLLLHGDAAFAGQGVVAECLGLSGLRGHRNGGTVHFIVNNQIGFTTSPKDSRSSPYPSDVALMVQAPIFHVNGDDPEAVVYAAKVASEYRQTFGNDVVVDMFCYRRYGHNEGDDPSFTQPLMYKRIKGHPTTREIYGKRLVKEGVATAAEIQGWIDEFEAFLDAEFDAGKTYRSNKADWLDGKWSGLGLPEDDDRRGKTDVDLDTLRMLGDRITTIPDTVNAHRTLVKVIDRRRQAIESGAGLDWATAEHLAFASLLDEGFTVRLSGQDSGRGTFSQRHSHIVDQATEERYTPLNHIREGQGRYDVIDSMLSEFAVLGFEYGYSLAEPNALVMWEAQFGDFANGAQVMFDQFISSGERKWLRMSGLVCLLPHGYEGQGPEHSSARLERFLQQSAEDNWQVANLSTPANYFHALRRQIHRDFRKPLILMTPKSLLRHKRCVSRLEDFGPGSSFHRVLLDDADPNSGMLEGPTGVTATALAPDENIRRVVLCSGKVYYDLLEERENREIDDIYLLRVEQFYPVPALSLIKELQRFKNAEVVWCQEEPENMGAWRFMEPNLRVVLDKVGGKSKAAGYAGRPATASTATGMMSKHLEERAKLLDAALSGADA